MEIDGMPGRTLLQGQAGDHVMTYLRVGTLDGRCVLEEVQRIGTMPETVLRRFRLELLPL